MLTIIFPKVKFGYTCSAKKKKKNMERNDKRNNLVYSYLYKQLIVLYKAT
jgi:hypothetical protein